MANGFHGSMPAQVFRDLVMAANPTDTELRFEVSRMNNYKNAGLYRGAEHIMGVNLNEFPEYTVRTEDGGIEAIGWREALTSLLTEGWIVPTEQIRTWLGDDGVGFALKGSGGESQIRRKQFHGWNADDIDFAKVY